MPWVVWAIPVAFYFLQFVVRTSLGVMTKPLLHDLSATRLDIGIIGASFYYAAVSIQIFTGALVDSFSIKKLLFLSLALTLIGTLFFSLSNTVAAATISRFFMGIGSAFSFVIAAKLATNWFPKNRFGFLACTTQSVGILGAVVGLIPVTYLVIHFQWRFAMQIIAATFAILITLALIFVKNYPPNHSHASQNTINKNFLKNIGPVIKSSNNWLIGFYLGLMCAPLTAFGELWGVSFFKETYHLNASMAATLTSMIFIGYGIGAPIFGWLSDRHNNRLDLMFYAAIINVFLFLMLIFSCFSSPTFLIGCALLFGILNGGSSLSYPFAIDLNPLALSGTVIAFVGMLGLLVGMLLQPVIGWFLDLAHSHGLLNYRLSMTILVLCLLLAVMITLKLKRKRA